MWTRLVFFFCHGERGWFVGFVLSVGFIERGLDELVEVSLIRRKQMCHW